MSARILATELCVLEKETPGSTSSVRIPLGELTGAELEDYRTGHPNAPGSSRSASARLVLLTKRTGPRGDRGRPDAPVAQPGRGERTAEGTLPLEPIEGWPCTYQPKARISDWISYRVLAPCPST